MKKLMPYLFFAILFSSCDTKEINEQKNTDEVSQEEIASYEVSSVGQKEDLVYEGDFTGKLLGKEIELKLKEETFKAKVDGKRVKGSVNRLSDGSKFELSETKGKLPVKHFYWAGPNDLMALDENGNFPKDESSVQYLYREN